MKLHVVNLRALALAEAQDTTPQSAIVDRQQNVLVEGGAVEIANGSPRPALAVTVHRVRTSRPRGVRDDRAPGELVKGVIQHPRYLSAFEDDLVTLDVSHHQSMGTKIISIDLSKQMVACNGGKSHYQTPMPLMHFPEALEALKVALNRTLERNHRGSVSQAVGKCRRGFLRVFAWMARQCVYRLADMDRDLLDTLVNQVAASNWHVLLEETAVLSALFERALNDLDLFERIYERHRKSGSFTLPVEELEAITGLPLNDRAIPRSIYKELSDMEGDRRDVRRRSDTHIAGDATEHTIRDLMETLNSLALSTPGSIKVLPFSKIAPAARKAIASARKARPAEGAKPGVGEPAKAENGLSTSSFNHHLNPEPRSAPKTGPGSRPTTNLTVDECADILAESLKWVYDYSPLILKTVEFARNEVEGLRETDVHALKKAWKRVYAFYEEEARNVAIPIKRIGERNVGPTSLGRLVKLLMYALFVDIGINTARRVSEQVGNDGVPYGLYKGALTSQVLADGFRVHRVDWYVTKSVQDWMVFPANQLVADAYAVLERLYDLNEFHSKAREAKSVSASDARKRKLFTLRTIVPGATSNGHPREEWRATERDEFLRYAGVDPKRFANSKAPFRRMFSVLFMHRYDLPEHPALKTYLAHLDAATTAGYFNDQQIREPGQSIRELHAPAFVDKDLLKEMANANVEYMAEQIHRMLKGEAIAGGFPAVAAKLAREMSANVDFATLSLEFKADAVAARLNQLGHRCAPMDHACCMAGRPLKTGEQAKCFRDGAFHREDASAKKCSGCVHESASDSYLAYVKEQLADSKRLSTSESCLEAVRRAHERRSITLQAVLDTAARAASRNRDLFKRAQESWEATVALHLTKTPQAAESGLLAENADEA